MNLSTPLKQNNAETRVRVLNKKKRKNQLQNIQNQHKRETDRERIRVSVYTSSLKERCNGEISVFADERRWR